MRDIDINALYPGQLTGYLLRLHEQLEWCKTNLGGRNIRWRCEFPKGFEFTNPKDETMFKMRFPT